MAKHKNKTNQNMKKQVQDNTTVLIVIIAALVFSFSAVWIKKSFDDLADYRQILSHERAVLEQLEENRANIGSLQVQAAELEREGLDIDTAVTALPLRFHPAADMANLEFLVSVSGLRIEDIFVDSGEDDIGGEVLQDFEGVRPYTIDIDVSGSYAGLKLFLRNVETSKQPMLLRQLQISSDGGVITTSLQVTLYYQGSSEAPAEEDEFMDIDSEFDGGEF